jgi:hypothetical protein
MVSLPKALIVTALLTITNAAIILIASMSFGSKLEAQHGPGHVECEFKWMETGKPAAEYEKFMQDCLAGPAPYEGKTSAPTEEWRHPEAVAEMMMNLSGKQPAKAMLYSQNRKREWGPYFLDAKSHTFSDKISCQLDEYICVGAWSEDGKLQWGVGYNSGKRCRNCCFRCDNRRHYWWALEDGYGHLIDNIQY